jgi:hypothetical protein
MEIFYLIEAKRSTLPEFTQAAPVSLASRRGSFGFERSRPALIGRRGEQDLQLSPGGKPPVASHLLVELGPRPSRQSPVGFTCLRPVARENLGMCLFEGRKFFIDRAGYQSM